MMLGGTSKKMEDTIKNFLQRLEKQETRGFKVHKTLSKLAMPSDNLCYPSKLLH